MAKMRIDLLIIDPQQDFMGNDDGSPYQEILRDGTTFSAALPVPGAISDMKRLTTMIDRVGSKLHAIRVTLDSHQVMHVANPGMWRDSNGHSPPPFTVIQPDDIVNGIWLPPDPGYRDKLLRYARALADRGNFPLRIWPEHCLIGTWGHNVYRELDAALLRWCRKEFATIDWVAKGVDVFTEHFGALEAEVPDPEEQSTQLNHKVLEILRDSDIIAVAGEASSHCVRETVRQIADNIGDEHLKKFRIIEDCMSSVIVPDVDLPALTKQFFGQMAQRGMQITNSTDFLA